MIGYVDWINNAIMQVQHFDEDQHVHITLDTKEKEFIN